MVQPANDLSANHLGGAKLVMNTTSATAIPAATAARFQNVATLQTYLLANGYTATQLSTMSKNDLVYAAKLKSGI